MSDSDSNALSFEESLAQLERIVRDLEDGKLGLDESLGRYERGVNLLKRCYAQLRQAEQRILLLTGSSEDGQPLTQPFQHSPTADPGGAMEKGKMRREPEILF
jgi:exodeoxyribonuclease VII small subunit